MRFFGSSKKDSKKRPQVEAETRTDATTKTTNEPQVTKDQSLRPLNADTMAQQQYRQRQEHSTSSPRKKDVQPMPIAVAAKPASSPRGEKGVIPSMQLQLGSNNSRSSPPTKHPEPAASSKHMTTGSGAARGGGGKAPPASILHKSKQPPPPTLNIPPPPEHTTRVRFMSASESVASSVEASQVHLMAGAAGSVASSSAMSSVPGENVFDRVLHAVMAEENQRLSAMGMTRLDPKNDYAAARMPSNARESLSPVPIHAGMEMDYHDLDDDDVNEKRGTSTLAFGMKDLMVDGGGSSNTRSRPHDYSSAAAYASSIGSKKSGAIGGRKWEPMDAEGPRKSGSSSARIRSAPTQRARVDDLAEF
ncbi:hypothetical protein ACHAXA_011192 [Cyclostephanos tholiformis]|jgi:hypothetical protein|uniref:Uncharacterized protein n=1 Tax=Cyclostephanos tholiformis TaxID=382380 RepID=A0ABD3R106_9STRA